MLRTFVDLMVGAKARPIIVDVDRNLGGLPTSFTFQNGRSRSMRDMENISEGSPEGPKAEQWSSWTWAMLSYLL